MCAAYMASSSDLDAVHLAEWPTLYAVASAQVLDEGFADAEVLGRGRQGQMKVACQLLLWNRWDSRGHSKSRAGHGFPQGRPERPCCHC